MRTAALLLILAAPAWAAPPEFDIGTIPKPVGGYIRHSPRTTAKAVTYVGLDGAEPFPSEELTDKRRFLLPVAGMVAGKAYRFRAVASLNDEHASVEFTVTLGEAPPPPPGPGPQPPPGPGPTPQPSTDPIGMGGFAVLMVFDPANTTRPPGELSVIYGKAVRDYLDAKCVSDPALPGLKAYRIYPENADVSRAPKAWADAFAKKGGKDWVLIGTGSGGYSGPLPKSEAEALALLRKYGG